MVFSCVWEVWNDPSTVRLRRAYKLHSKMRNRGLEHSILAVTFLALLLSTSAHAQLELPGLQEAAASPLSAMEVPGLQEAAASPLSEAIESNADVAKDLGGLVLPSLRQAVADGESIGDVRARLQSLRRRTEDMLVSVRSRGLLEGGDDDSGLAMPTIRGYRSAEGPFAEPTIVLEDAINSKRRQRVTQGSLD